MGGQPPRSVILVRYLGTTSTSSSEFKEPLPNRMLLTNTCFPTDLRTLMLDRLAQTWIMQGPSNSKCLACGFTFLSFLSRYSMLLSAILQNAVLQEGDFKTQSRSLTTSAH